MSKNPIWPAGTALICERGFAPPVRATVVQRIGYDVVLDTCAWRIPVDVLQFVGWVAVEETKKGGAK
jgi:hypothetical protein